MDEILYDKNYEVMYKKNPSNKLASINRSDKYIPVYKSLFSLKSLIQIIPESGYNFKYCFNCCIHKVENGYRLFYRAVKNKYGDDKILTCLLDLNFIVKTNSTKILDLWSESGIQKVGFKNKEHVEDPRIVLHEGFWYICYTDGWEIAIAKLDFETCETIYTNYLEKPAYINYEGGDGREKNWLPISYGKDIKFWYSDSPRTFLVFTEDSLSNKLKYKTYISSYQKISCSYGNGKIYGSCPPVEYEENKEIWFFHTKDDIRYMIGAYITQNDMVIQITKNPILIGDTIVFPCGVINTEIGWTLSMGVEDKIMCLLHVDKEILEKDLIEYK